MEREKRMQVGIDGSYAQPADRPQEEVAISEPFFPSDTIAFGGKWQEKAKPILTGLGLLMQLFC